MVNVKVVLICTEPSRFVRLLARPRLPPSAARCAYTSTTNERRERKMSCLLASHDGNGGGEVKNAETSSPPTRDVGLFLPLPVPHCKHETSSSPVMALAPFAQSLPTKTYSTILRRRVSSVACPYPVQMPVWMGSLPSGSDAPKKVKNGKFHTQQNVYTQNPYWYKKCRETCSCSPEKKTLSLSPMSVLLCAEIESISPQVVFVVVVSASCKVLIPLYVAAQCDLTLGRACPET